MTAAQHDGCTSARQHYLQRSRHARRLQQFVQACRRLVGCHQERQPSTSRRRVLNWSDAAFYQWGQVCNGESHILRCIIKDRVENKASEAIFKEAHRIPTEKSMTWDQGWPPRSVPRDPGFSEQLRCGSHVEGSLYRIEEGHPFY